jgi:hypothetical protein
MIHPPKETAGKTAEQRRFNELRRYVLAIRPLKGRGIRVSETARGTVIQSEAEGGGEGTPLWG